MTKYFIFIMIPIWWPCHIFNANREAGDFSEKIPPVTWAVALKTALCLVKSLCVVNLFPLHVAVSIHSLRFRNNIGRSLGVWVYNCVWYIRVTNWKISVWICVVCRSVIDRLKTAIDEGKQNKLTKKNKLLISAQENFNKVSNEMRTASAEVIWLTHLSLFFLDSNEMVCVQKWESHLAVRLSSWCTWS